MLELIRWIKEINENVKKDHLGAYAAQSAYFIILSAVPFIMFLFILLNRFEVDANSLINFLVGAVPGEADKNLVENILTDVTSRTNGAILSFTIVTLLWAAGKGILAITRGLNTVYNIEETRNYIILRIIATLYTFIFAIVIIFTLAFLVFGNRLYLWICEVIPFLNNVAAFVISIRTIASLLILTLFFTCIYKFLPNRKNKIKHQFPGALFTASGWMISSYVFSIYIDYSPNLSYMYGSLTGLILLMLWLYLCMNIMFLGAEINHMIYPDEEEKPLNYIYKGKQ